MDTVASIPFVQFDRPISFLFCHLECLIYGLVDKFKTFLLLQPDYFDYVDYMEVVTGTIKHIVMTKSYTLATTGCYLD